MFKKLSTILLATVLFSNIVSANEIEFKKEFYFKTADSIQSFCEVLADTSSRENNERVVIKGLCSSVFFANPTLIDNHLFYTANDLISRCDSLHTKTIESFKMIRNIGEDESSKIYVKYHCNRKVFNKVKMYVEEKTEIEN